MSTNSITDVSDLMSMMLKDDGLILMAPSFARINYYLQEERERERERFKYTFASIKYLLTPI